MEVNGNPYKDRDKRVSVVCMRICVTTNLIKSVYYRLALKSNVVKCSLIC